MRRALGLTLPLVLALGACQIRAVEPPREGIPLRSARAPKSPPEPLAPAMLLKGHVRIDAGYVVSAGGGRIVSSNGGSLIEANAGTLISDHGLGLVSNNGGSLIGNHGAGLIGNNGGGYRLLDAAGLGEMLPVKGMMVAPASLLTGQLIGEPALTDEQGAYTLAVPEGYEDNVRIIAAIPGKNAEDPLLADRRLHYDLLVAPESGAEHLIDEDQAMLTTYVRMIFSQQLLNLLSRSEAEFPAYLERLFQGDQMADLGAFKGVIEASLGELHQKALAAGVPDLPRAEQQGVALRVADAMLATIDLRAVRLNKAYYDMSGYGYEGWESTVAAFPADRPVLEALLEVFVFLRQRAAAVMTANGGTFPSTFYLEASNAEWAAAGEPIQEIKRPSDINDYMVRHYATVDYGAVTESDVRRPVFESLGAAFLPGTGLVTEGVIRAAQSSIMVELQRVLLTDAEVKANVDRALRGNGQGTP